MLKTNKIFKMHYTLYIVPILSLLFITHSTSALEYQNNTNIQFTFSPAISISISGNLSIDNLSPGTAKDSNIVDVNVATNNVSGCSLSATVGTNTTNDKLTNINNSDYYFTNLSSNVSDIASFNDNTWGYSYSVDNGANWVSGSQDNTSPGYNGLPLDANTNTNELGKGGITLLDTTNPADSKTIKFKIGARADNTQASGTYTNTINFYAIAKVPPISISDAFASASKTQLNGYYKMQDMSPTICNMTQTIDEDSQTQLIDIRDNKIYWVAKLQDGHCWMTQNLGLNLDSTAALTSNDTDLSQFGQNNYDANNGYLCSNDNSNCENGVIFWKPINDTILIENNQATGWGNSNELPFSAGTEPFIADNENGRHGYVGNYYSWSAAIASNNSSSFSENTFNNIMSNPKNSICPVGWRLPTVSANSSSEIGSTNEFGRLAILYAGKTATPSEKITAFLSSPLFFVKAGMVDGSNSSLVVSGYAGYCWSSTISNGSSARRLQFFNNTFDQYDIASRSTGLSVRCLAK